MIIVLLFALVAVVIFSFSVGYLLGCHSASSKVWQIWLDCINGFPDDKMQQWKHIVLTNKPKRFKLWKKQ